MAPKPSSPPKLGDGAVPQPSQRGAESQRKGKVSQRGASPSQRGAKGEKSSVRKKQLTTAEKLEERTNKQKEKSKAALTAISENEKPPPLAEVSLDGVEPLELMLAPTQKLTAELRAQLEKLSAKKALLSPPPPITETIAKVNSPTVLSVSKSSFAKVWKGLAEEKLAEMASSLEGALLNEAKLKELFEHIDLDKSGTVEPAELGAAIRSMGKGGLSEEQVETMIKEASADGVLTLATFGYILKGVAAASAATVIEHRAREHVKVSKARAKRKGGGVGKAETPTPARGIGGGESAAAGDEPAVEITDEAARTEFERQLGDALLGGSVAPRDLVMKWDRKHKGAITRMEFRIGVREDLGLRGASNALIDAYFGKFDIDGGGTIDVPELRDGLDWLSARATREHEEYAITSAKMDEVTRDLAGFDKAVGAATKNRNDFDAEMAKLTTHRTTRDVGAIVGVKLNSKLRSESNPKGLDLPDLIAKWDFASVTQGWMTGDEFVKVVAAEMSDATLKKMKTDLKKSIDPSDAVGNTGAKDAAEKAQTGESLSKASMSEEEVRALFTTLLSNGDADKPVDSLSGSVEVARVLAFLMEADVKRRAQDVLLLASCEALKAEGLTHVEILAAGLDAFAEREVDAQNKAKAKAAEEEEAKVRAVEAKAKAEADKKLEAAKKAEAAKMPAFIETAEAPSAAATEAAPPSADPAAAPDITAAEAPAAAAPAATAPAAAAPAAVDVTDSAA